MKTSIKGALAVIVSSAFLAVSTIALAITPGSQLWATMMLAGAGRSGAPPAGPTYSYRGGSASLGSGPVGTSATYAIDIGTASADRLIVVGAINDAAITGITVNGVTLTLNVSAGTSNSVIYSGLVASGSGTQNVVVTTSTNMQFASNGVAVWAL